MEWNSQSNAKPTLDCTDELYEKRLVTQKSFKQEIEEISVLLKEVLTETLVKFFFPNEVELQSIAEQLISQSEYGEEEILGDSQRKEEDILDNNDYNWILFDEKFTYGEDEVFFQEEELYPAKHEEDLIHKRETLFHLKKQLGYKVKWTFFDEQFILGGQDEFTQERKIHFQKKFIYGAEEIMKRDLLFGRVALLWRLVWLRKKPRVRFK